MRFLKHLALVFSLLPFLSHGQSKWTTIHLDKHLSFTIPSEYKKSDTLGQVNFRANTDFAYIQVAKIPQPQAQITNKQELIDYYVAFQKLTIEQSYGDIFSESTIELNDLSARIFQFENFWNDSLEVQENTIVFVDKSMYSFTYAYFKDEKQLAKRDKEIFSSGITFHATDFKDQLTIERNKNEEAGEFVGYIMRYIIIATILLAVILFFLKKYRLVKSILNILSLASLTWGATCLFLYIVNLFMENKLDLLLTGGVVCLIVGFVLRKIKLPQTK